MKELRWHRFYDAHVPKHMTYPETDLFALFKTACEGSKNRDAVSFMGKTITYGDLLSQVDRLAAAVSSKGIDAGDRVILLMPNCPQFVIGYYALMKLGAVAVLANLAENIDI